MSVRSRSCVLLVAGLLACDNDEAEGMTQAWTPDGTASEGSAEDSGGDMNDSAAADDGGDDGDGASCPSPCTTPPGDCFEDESLCQDGACVDVPVLAGDACTDGCNGGGFCDATGNCICVEDCASTCTAGANATAMCDDAGMCVRACTAPFDNCDGDWANGCEVPVGVPHQCDINGLNPEGGCWTAYCGASDAAGTFDFGTYHCVDCSTCGVPSGGQCHWCNHDNGNWFPTEACSCGAEFENAVCGPA